MYEFNLPVNGAILSIHYSPKEKIITHKNLVLGVSDIDQFKEILNSKNIESSEIKDMPDVMSFLNSKDPDGNQNDKKKKRSEFEGYIR